MPQPQRTLSLTVEIKAIIRMPVDRQTRDELANHLRLLVDGQSSHTVYCDLYYSKWERSDDEAVRKVAEFGHGLYSDDLPPFKLTNLPVEIREEAERAVLFLRSDVEYPWPINVFRRPLPGDWRHATILISIGLILLVIGLNVDDFPWEFEWGTLALLAILVGLWILDSRAWSAHRDKLRRVGDPDVWPFLRRSDYEIAISHNSTSS